MSSKRAKARDILIPIPMNPDRRRSCIGDAEMFLKTYFPDVFYEDFTHDRREMVRMIVNAAKFGGDQAIAGPRGEGKTKLAIYVSLYLMLANLSTFPVVIGKSQSKAQNELKTIKEKLQQASLFINDFPEIGIPFQAVGGWSSRARMQTVNGKYTNLVLASDHIIFPTISRSDLLSSWPKDIEPASNGQIMASIGVDGPIRGTNYRDRRPTIAVIDDIEDREAASSDALIQKNEEIIEQDIAGLGPSSTRVSRAMLCTIQNRRCIAYRYTDPKQKPSWNGKRYRKMIKVPDRMDLVQQYIAMRQDKGADDSDARAAFRFWRDNKDLLEAGCEISNESSFDRRMHIDGEPLELSAVQAYFNRVADLGEKAVATEIDNDPPEETGPVGSGLTWETIIARCSGLQRLQMPMNTMCVTAGIDLGKYRCHWTLTAWSHGAAGVIIDYGVAEVTGTDIAQDNESSEPMIYKALLNWRDEILGKTLVDAAGEERKLDFCFIDSGAFTNAAYEFVKQVGHPFHVSKGVFPYKRKERSSDTLIAGANLHAQRLQASGVWLYELDTSYWKQWVHERFLSPTFDEQNMLRKASLSLFESTRSRNHMTFAKHIVAEEYVSEFKEGKGSKQYWRVVNDNNHWLDATYLACAASEVCGVKLIAPTEFEVKPTRVKEGEQTQKQKPARQHGQFKQRPGGWVPRRR